MMSGQGRARLPWRFLMFVWKYAVGVLLCLTPLSAILVVGWTYRLMQRATLKRWHRLSGIGADGAAFHDFAIADSRTATHVAWPNWLLGAPDAPWRIDAGPGRVTVLLQRVAGSFGANLRIGIQASLNTALVMLPIGALWLLSWWGGWQNSFHKGYEESWVGQVVGFLGIAMFMVVMTYLPLAQARQASTGSWRAFWDVLLLRRLVRRRRLGGLGLALLYMVLAAPLMALRAAPVVIGEFVEELPPERITEVAEQFFLASTALLFPLYIVVRLVAARLYAGAILDAVRSGDVGLEELGVEEREALGRLRVAADPNRPRGHAVGRMAVSLPRGLLLALTLAAWFAVTAQLYVSQFLNYAWFSWLNHPLIQLPWIRYLPAHG